jgi:ribosomal protein S18 acetylase RimI-like enzyme
MKIINPIDDTYLDQIVAFQQAMALETENMHLDSDVLNRGVKEVLENPSRGRYFLAVENHKVIGMLLTIPEWSDWRCKEVVWIHSVYIPKENRKKGLYKALYLHVKTMVESSDKYAGIRLYVDKTNKSAISVYEKLGMSNEHYDLFEWLK